MLTSIPGSNQAAESSTDADVLVHGQVRYTCKRINDDAMPVYLVYYTSFHTKYYAY